MDRSTAVLKVIVATQLLATGALHAASSDISNSKQDPVLHSLEGAVAQTPADAEVGTLMPSSLGDDLLLTLPEPTNDLQISVTKLGCAGDAELQDIEMKAFGVAGELVEHAKLVPDQIDHETVVIDRGGGTENPRNVVYQGSIYDTKIDHGVVLDETAGHDPCDATAKTWKLRISTAVPIRNLLLVPVRHDDAGIDENKSNHGVVLIDD